MFPADAVISSYIEEQSARYKAKRAEAEAAAQAAKTPSSGSTSSATTTLMTPSAAAKQIDAKPAGMLGSLWQDFFRTPNSTNTPSASSSVTSTPTIEKSQQEAYAERMREIDICAMRVY